MSQPTMTPDHGVRITIGINVNNDRCQLTIPMATDTVTSIDDNTLCANAVDAIVNGAVTPLLACLCTSAYISFIQGEGLKDGKVPYRNVYASTDLPGIRSGGAMPSQVAALVTFYEDAADVEALHKIGVAHNFVPGISETDVTADLISSALKALFETFASTLVSGVPDTHSNVFYRVLSGVVTGSGTLKRVSSNGCRSYVGTQRRRLVPHF